MAGRIVTNEQGQKAWWDGKTLKPLTENDIATGRAGPDGAVMSDTKTDQDALEQTRAKGRMALAAAKVAEEFVGLNGKAMTGGMAARPVVPLTKALPGAPLWGDMAASFTRNSAWDEMKSITSGLIPKMREAGSGPMTEGDAQMYREALPSINTGRPANIKTAKRLQATSDEAVALSAFKDRWFARHGTLLGSDKAFNEFWTKRQAGDPVANNVQPKRLKFNPATGDFE